MIFLVEEILRLFFMPSLGAVLPIFWYIGEWFKVLG